MPGEEVIAEAYDVPIPGYKTKTCSNLRLWDALPTTELDLEAFNAGNYVQARARRPPQLHVQQEPWSVGLGGRCGWVRVGGDGMGGGRTEGRSRERENEVWGCGWR